MEEEFNTTSDLETMAGCDIVDSKDKLCLRGVKPVDPNLHITSSSQNEEQNASCVGSTAPDLSNVTVKLEIGNADEKGCNVAKYNTPGPSSSIPKYIGDSDEYKLSTCNTSNSMTIGLDRPISPVRKTVDNEIWMKKEPRSPTDSFPTLNIDTIVIHSKVDNMVAGNADLENDIAGKPLYSNNTLSLESDWNRVKHEPTEVVLTEQKSRRNGPTGTTRKRKHCSDKYSENLIADNTSNPRKKGNFVCRICLKRYILCSAVKTHMIQKHPQCSDHCILAKNDNKDLDRDFQRLWFCPKNCKYLTSQHNALLEHLVTCQKPNLLPYSNSAGNAEMLNNLSLFEIDKGHGGDISAEDLMVHIQQTEQASNIPGQSLEHEMQTVDQDLKDISTCKLCDLVFSTSLLLEDHMKDCHKEQHISTCTREGTFKCTHCNKGFSRNCDLFVHMRTHTGEKPYKCTHCIKSFSQSSQLYVHMRIHTGEKPFTCTHCNKGFSRSGDLRVHIRTHTGEKPFKCTHCNKSFSQSSQLYVHMRLHTGEKPFTCTHCNKGFIRSCDLRMHLRMHTGEKPFNCTHCDKGFSRSCDLRVHMITHTGEKPFTCTHCNKGFSRSCDLRMHLRIHTGEKPFKCTHCNKCFSRSRDLRVHMIKHTGEKPFKCSHCNKSFSRSGQLCVHMRIHTGEKPFKCTHCNKSFSQSGNLLLHMRTHTGETPFRCTQCNKVFHHNGNLRVHMRTHTGEKPFKCTHCNKCFGRSDCLRVHMRTHTEGKPFKCTHCDKGFKRSRDFRVHMGTCSGEKAFKCTHCNKSFCRSCDLRIHMRTHTHTGEKLFKSTGTHFNKGSSVDRDFRLHMRIPTLEKPFKCTHCNKSFCRNGNLLLHMRTHTGE